MNEIHDYFQSNLSIIMLALGLGGGLLLFLVIILYQLQIHKRSIYLEEAHRVELSEIRESFEQKLAKLTMEMTSTQQRWTEVNHLLLEAQKTRAKTKPPAPRSESRLLSQIVSRNFRINYIDIKSDPKLILYLTPFSSDEFDTYSVVREACTRVGFTCLRGDETNHRGDILSHIVKLILNSRLIIANITSRNSNVMYELGIAHTIGKPVVLISKTIEQLPFDIQSHRIVLYKKNEELEQILYRSIITVLAEEDNLIGNKQKNIDTSEISNLE